MIDIKNIIIKEIDINETELLRSALAMMNRTQGDSLFSMSYLTSKIESKDALALGAFINEELISVGCAELISNYSYYTPFEAGIAERLKDKTVGSLCTLCVREDYQGKGIGQLVSKKRIQWLEQRGCDFILGVSWKSGLKHTSNRVFEKMGFELINTVDEFFKEDAIKYPFNCPGCKVHPCLCSAALYQFHF